MCSNDPEAGGVVSSLSWFQRKLHEAGQLEHRSLAKLRTAQNYGLDHKIYT